jgi:hypothetical protein
MTQGEFENLLGSGLAVWRLQILRVEAFELQAAVGAGHLANGRRKISGALDFQPKGLLAGRAARKRIAAYHKKYSP